jgi:hypothetical protein
MKNKILSIFSNTIPYIKELRPVAGTVTAAIVMQQLDYWFARKPNGFYKYLEPPKMNASFYKKGDSWCEEIGLSAEEFQNAFKNIAVAYKSKTEFRKALDENTVFFNEAGAEKFYARYYDRDKGLSFYYRNHALVDKVLDDLVYSLETDNVGLRETEDVGLPIALETEDVGLRETEKVGVGVHGTETTVQENTSSEITSFAVAKAPQTNTALSTLKLPNQPLIMSKDDVVSALLELESLAVQAENIAKTSYPTKSKEITPEEGELFKVFNHATHIIAAGAVNWTAEGRHCKTLIKDLRTASYTAKDVINCIAWGYWCDKYSFYKMSATSVQKLMPMYLDEVRTGKILERFNPKKKFETNAERNERIAAERNKEEIIKNAARFDEERAAIFGTKRRPVLE